MKRTRVPLLAFLALLLAAPSLLAVQVGEVAPDFTLTDTQGVQHTLSDYRGTVVMLFFFGYS